MLADIRHHARYAKEFRKQYIGHLKYIVQENEQKSWKPVEKDADKAEKRIAALDDIIKKLLEQNAAGRISDERFYTLSAEYEAEQSTLKEQLAEMKECLNKAREDKKNAEIFTGLIDKYVNLKELNAQLLNELIEEIVVHDRETVDKQTTQQVDIYYKFIGFANIYV